MFGQQDNINLEIHESKNVYLRLYGVVFVLILACIIGIGYYYLNSIEYFALEKISGTTKIKADTTKVVADLPMIKGTVSPPVDLKLLLNSSPEQVAKGRELYTTNCGSCHGNEGKGDGIAAASMNPKPRNFTVLDGWKNGFKPGQIYKTLQEGIIATGMPAFANITPEDRFAIIHFIRSINAGIPPATADELAELDKTYSLSAGVKSPNQIPVQLAKEKLVQENGADDSGIAKVLTILEHDTTKSAAVFKRVADNREKALRSLLSNQRWLRNENEFVSVITTGVGNNGFRSGVVSLTAKEVSDLYAYLKNLISTNFTLQQQG
jgi:mono/diheme cytochrome c family protein